MSKPKEYSWMTRNLLMTYTFIGLLILAVVTSILWFPVETPSKWSLGLTLGIDCIIAVGVAVGIDALLHKVTSDSLLNTTSAAVFGLVVALSYTLGIPFMNTGELLPLEAPNAFIYVALISIIGLVVFKKIVGLSGRKYVNPAAAAKLVVLVPFLNTLLIVLDHLKSSLLGVPSLAGPLGWGLTPIGKNGVASWASYLVGCFSNPNVPTPAPTMNNALQTMLLDKFHGWPGGASSIAVIIVGLGLFVVARRYIKWRITLAYFVSVTIMSLIMSLVYADQDLLLRLLFEIFIGSSIFLAFFMATDPATTPLTYTGQAMFGVGLGVLTVVIQTFLNFFGGSILALIIMNLTSPFLDKIGLLKPMEESKEPRLPRAKQFTTVITVPCMRCGACVRVCCHKLSPILIKEAFDKNKIEKLMKLKADYCTACGHCTYVCPSRIDLRNSVLRAKAALRTQK
jgi:electron transport complex protein RnfD